MEEIGAFEAKTHFSKLLKKVMAGESFVITKHGFEVAQLIPTKPSPHKDTEKVVEKIRRFRTGNRLGKLSINSLREMGRK